MAKATAAARRAIDSTIAESYTALAYANLLLNDNRGADREFRKALALDSAVATAWGWYGLLASHIADFPEAHRRIARARELEPASLIARIWDAQVYVGERRYGAADSLATETLGLDSTFTLASSVKAEAMLLEGRGAEAVAILERRVAELPPHRPSETHGILTLLGEAVAKHDAWLLQYTKGERYDKLRKDPRGAALLAKAEAW